MSYLLPYCQCLCKNQIRGKIVTKIFVEFKSKNLGLNLGKFMTGSIFSKFSSICPDPAKFKFFTLHMKNEPCSEAEHHHCVITI